MVSLALAILLCIGGLVVILAVGWVVGSRRRRRFGDRTPVLPQTPLGKDTVIGTWTAQLLRGVFLVLIALPATYEFVAHRSEQWQRFRRFFAAPTGVARKELEQRLTRDTEWARTTRHLYQQLLTRTLRQGSSQVIVGPDGELFFRDDLRFVLEPGFLSPQFAKRRGPRARTEDLWHRLRNFLQPRSPDPVSEPAPARADDVVTAIVDFRDQLEARGIHLVVLPIPCKASIYPDHLWANFPQQAGPPLNVDFGLWLRRLAESGVDVLNLTAPFWDAGQTAKRPLWLRYDTHWSPAGVALTADHLAAHLRPWLGNVPRRQFHTIESVEWEGVEGGLGDLILLLLERHSCPDSFRPAQYSFFQILDRSKPAVAGDEAPVLLLGDSFAYYYYPEGGGLAQHLMRRLATGVQQMDIFSCPLPEGPSDPRLILAQRPEALRAKKVVVWEFTARNLTDPARQWVTIPLGEEAAR